MTTDDLTPTNPFADSDEDATTAANKSASAGKSAKNDAAAKRAAARRAALEAREADAELAAEEAAAEEAKRAEEMEKVKEGPDGWRFDKVPVRFHEAEDMPPGGIQVQVNGYAYVIQPGVVVEVPRAVLGVIDNAIQTKPVISADGKVRGYRDVPRYSYTRMD